MNVVVVGAGIAGLCVASRLSRRHEVHVLERKRVAGGKIRSQRVGGFVFDWGPNGLLTNSPEVTSVVREAGLENELIKASPAVSKRYVYWAGKLHALQPHPARALSMSLISTRAKLRALAELFARPLPPGSIVDEDVDAFFARHFGAEVAERIVAPALLGISGGDAKRTSLAALFPGLAALEQKHGSLIRAMLTMRRKSGRIASFGVHGLARLTNSLGRLLGDRLLLDCEAQRIERTRDGWKIHHQSGHLDAHAVVLCTPSYRAAEILADCDGALSNHLRRIEYAPMRVVGIAFADRDVPVPLDGFGFLAARGQGIRILGALYTSTIFPDQAPKNTAYLRVFLGGSTDPEALSLNCMDACSIVRADLHAALRIRAKPVEYHETLWSRAIPQYAIGHRELVASIDERLCAHRGLALAGNAYRGIGLADTVRDAFRVADALG